jgi:hypothetical protein
VRKLSFGFVIDIFYFLTGVFISNGDGSVDMFIYTGINYNTGDDDGSWVGWDSSHKQVKSALITGYIAASGGEVYFGEVSGEGDELFIASCIEWLSEVGGFGSSSCFIIVVGDIKIKSAETSRSIGGEYK